MYKQKLCLGTAQQFGISIEEQIRLFKKTGFEAFFTMWDGRLKEYKKIADDLGMIYQSVHAPYLNAAAMWQSSAASERAVEELLVCVEDCADINVPILVVHPYIGFEECYQPNREGIENFRRVIEAAKLRNVNIAFENVEGQAYLDALMNEFYDHENVGFCWDSGHEQCYNKGKDMLRLYGSKLIATHLNDNLGISDNGGKIFWTDDLHLLPFDGINNWEDIAERLIQCGYNGILTFELLKQSKPNRHDNDKYSRMPVEEYIAECYARACRVAALVARGCKYDK